MIDPLTTNNAISRDSLTLNLLLINKVTTAPRDATDDYNNARAASWGQLPWTTLFVEISTFLPWRFGYVEKRLDKKAMVNFKIYVTTDCTRNTVHILPTISWSKGNQAMKFGQTIKYSMRNIFVQNSCRKWGWETSYRSSVF